MPLTLFSPQGIEYQDPSRGPITAIFIPQADKIRRYADLQSASQKEIASRYGEAGRKPIKRVERGQVVVYGTIDPKLTQRIEDLTIFLPEQLVPPKCNVFYLVFGTRVVHGVQTIDDEGHKQWQVVLLPLPTTSEDHQGQLNDQVTTQIVSSAAERLILHKDEVFCIAVTGNDVVLEQLKEQLTPYEQEVTRIETLKRAKDQKPLYRHYNYSLILIFIALCAAAMVIASGVFWHLKEQEIKQNRQEIRGIQADIRAIPKNERVGHIQNPKSLLDEMEKPLWHKPSSLLNGASQLGAEFGELSTVYLDTLPEEDTVTPRTGWEDPTNLNQPPQIELEAHLNKMHQAFLVDQEQKAKQLTQQYPWLLDVKSFNRSGAAEGAMLLFTLGLANETNTEVTP